MTAPESPHRARGPWTLGATLLLVASLAWMLVALWLAEMADEFGLVDDIGRILLNLLAVASGAVPAILLIASGGRQRAQAATFLGMGILLFFGACVVGGSL